MIKASIQTRIESLVEYHEEINQLLSNPEIIHDQTEFRNLSKKYSELTGLVESFLLYKKNDQDIQSLQEMQNDPDLDIRQLASEELKKAILKSETLEADLYTFLLPTDPNDKRNIFLEIRAGTGGNEAALFAGDLFRMYMKFAEKQSWRVELINESFGEQGGYKEVIVRIIGNAVYSKLKFESGAHRVQRVPLTESQGRIHTSACTVAILPEVETIEFVEIDPGQLRIDTYRASGAGGQHVNRTDSAVRITHLPSGIVVECQDERSQHKNKARALSVLQAKLLSSEQEKQQKEQAATRKSLVGSGDRSERIRTYNFPQGRITDHRINLTLYRLEEVLEGFLLLLIEPLMHEYKTEQLANLNQ